MYSVDNGGVLTVISGNGEQCCRRSWESCTVGGIESAEKQIVFPKKVLFYTFFAFAALGFYTPRSIFQAALHVLFSFFSFL